MFQYLLILFLAQSQRFSVFLAEAGLRTRRQEALERDGASKMCRLAAVCFVMVVKASRERCKSVADQSSFWPTTNHWSSSPL